MKSMIQSTKAKILLVLLFALATVGAGAGSLALLTDSVAINQKDTIATIDLTVNGNGFYNVPERIWFGTGTQYQPVVLKNAGNSEIRYAIASTVTGNPILDTELRITGRAFPGNAAGLCNAIDFLNTGTTLNGTTLSPSAFDFGSPSQGAQAGDRVLLPAQEETICMKVNLPAGYTATGSLTWSMLMSAEQTYLNP